MDAEVVNFVVTLQSPILTPVRDDAWDLQYTRFPMEESAVGLSSLVTETCISSAENRYCFVLRALSVTRIRHAISSQDSACPGV